MIDYSKFQKSLRNLGLQFENYQTCKQSSDFSDLIKEGLAESCIQRFEVCYDCLWKVLKRYLKEDLGIPDVPNSPKPNFRLANENQLLGSPVESWLKYADMRTDTAHDYDGDKAENCLDSLGNFIADAQTLYQTMTGQTWK